MKECINCNGTGEIIVIEGQVEYTCPICNGTGKVKEVETEDDLAHDRYADELEIMDGIMYRNIIDY